MADDNTLGAPTEGLGQTVTFAGPAGSRVPQATAIQRGQVRNNAQGGQARRSAEAIMPSSPVGNTTFQVLARLGGDLIKPQLEAERQLSYAKGYQQAAQGAAITEIVDEQPWYSKVFGSTSLVDGARAYSASAKATAVVTDMETNMPELRKLGANEMAQWTAKAMAKAASTGDATTDAMIYHQLGQTLPTGLKSQAKAHLHYQGEMLGEKITDAMMSTGAHLGVMNAKARDKQDITDMADEGEARIEFSKTFQRPETMPKETHNKLLTDSVVRMLGTGNFAASKALRDSKKFDELDPQQQYSIRRAEQQASLDARNAVPIEFLREATKWLISSRDATEEAMIAGAAELNQEYTRRTGDHEPYVTNAKLTQELLQRDAAEVAAEKARIASLAPLAKADAKAQLAITEATNLVKQMISPAGIYIGDKSKDEQQAALTMLANSVPPVKRFEVLATQAEVGVYDQTLREQLVRGYHSAVKRNNPIDLQAVYESTFKPLIEAGGGRGEAVAMEYAGKEVGEALLAWHHASGGRPVTEANVGLVYDQVVDRKPAVISGKDDEDRVEALRTGRTWKAVYAMGRVLGGQKYPLENPEYVYSLIKKNIPRNMSDKDEAVKVALANSKDVADIGGFGVLVGANETRLDEYFIKRHPFVDKGVSKDNYQVAMRQAIDAAKDSLGISNGLSVGQLHDAPGKIPRIYVSGLDKNGDFTGKIMTAPDIADLFLKSETARPATAFGEPIATHRDLYPKDGRPSLYAGDAAWRAYAARMNPPAPPVPLRNHQSRAIDSNPLPINTWLPKDQ